MCATKLVLDLTTQQNIDNWLNGDYDEASKEQVRYLQQNNPVELINAFYQQLSFGTGGLRGLMGVGSNRINTYTIRTATQGLANYIHTQTQNGSVLVAYDCRQHSADFAYETARVLAANGIKVFIFNQLRPVPLVSFGVLYKQCTAGVMITASHNPPQYNGYKIYWSDGGQLLPPHEQEIIHHIRCVQDIKIVDLPHPLVEHIEDQIDCAFLHALKQKHVYAARNSTQGHKLKIVYTNLHGTGVTILPKALEEAGFKHVELVKEQQLPDGHFSTVTSPNPEEPAALSLGMSYLQAHQGDLLMGTDPDADRIGVVVMHQGEPCILNGNELACIATEHICHALTHTGSMPTHPIVIKTIVTSELMRKIAETYGVECLDVLTGFKYIGQKIAQWEAEKKAGLPTHHFIFGAEESYGYLTGTYARDKDAIGAAVLIADMALTMKLQGKTLVDFLHNLYAKYGVYRESLRSVVFEGKQGAESMRAMMRRLRQNPPKTLGGVRLSVMEDYQTGQVLDVLKKNKTPLFLPQSDVIRMWLEDGTNIVVRPSGTEPKIKLYCAVKNPLINDLHATIKSCDHRLHQLLEELVQILLST